jgi:excisionase family DNA binding protein
MKMDQLVTVRQAADLLSCSEAAIRKWISQRRLPAVKVGRLTRLRQKDLEVFVSHGSRASTVLKSR